MGKGAAHSPRLKEGATLARAVGARLLGLLRAGPQLPLLANFDAVPDLRPRIHPRQERWEAGPLAQVQEAEWGP